MNDTTCLDIGTSQLEKAPVGRWLHCKWTVQMTDELGGGGEVERGINIGCQLNGKDGTCCWETELGGYLFHGGSEPVPLK